MILEVRSSLYLQRMTSVWASGTSCPSTTIQSYENALQSSRANTAIKYYNRNNSYHCWVISNTMFRHPAMYFPYITSFMLHKNPSQMRKLRLHALMEDSNPCSSSSALSSCSWAIISNRATARVHTKRASLFLDLPPRPGGIERESLKSLSYSSLGG